MLMAFSGPSLMEGQEAFNGCLPAATVINDAGGVMGADVSCKEFDTAGTPNEAVPAARQMLSSTPNLLSVVGPSTAESVAAAPVLEEASQTMFSVAGDGRFDRNENEYYYRLISSDSVAAKAMALHVQALGHEEIALVFPAGASAQANVPPLEAAAETLDIKISNNLTIESEQASYRTEVARVVDSDPDAIIFEGDAVTSGTFLSDLVQAGGEDIPLITTVWAQTGEWRDAATEAYGGPEKMEGVVETVTRVNDTSGDGFKLFDDTLKSMSDEEGIDYDVFSTSVYSQAHYDGVIIAALAATKAESTESADFNPLIPELLTASDSKTVVTNYADGVSALENGEDIQYVGASGELTLNEYQNVTGEYASYKWDAAGERFVLDAKLDSDELAELNVAD